MNVADLLPRPSYLEAFRRDRVKFVPEAGGCYVLTTFEGKVLYVGLAVNLRRRMDEHLDNPEKTSPTPIGRAILFHWFECDDHAKVERTWMNMHISVEGALPYLNRAYIRPSASDLECGGGGGSLLRTRLRN